MSQQFNEVRVSTTARSTFDLSHHQVTTTDFGYILPIFCKDMVPNDDFVVNPSVFIRLAPLGSPAYGRIKARVHSFFVPYRILFDKWDSFLTGSTNTVPPYVTCGQLRNIIQEDPQFGGSSETYFRGVYGRILSNLGINPMIFTVQSRIPDNKRFAVFSLMAYYRIWLDYFMDSNINDHSVYDQNFKQYCHGGNVNAFISELLKTRYACFGKDYFTTAKLHPQAGSDPSLVGVDLADSSLNPGLTIPSSNESIMLSPSGNVFTPSSASSPANSKIGEFTVEELRVATSYQRYLERNNYVGTKIINQLLAHFGIAPTAERLDMAEYLGGSNFNVQIGDVTSTASTAATDLEPETVGIGAVAGKGIAASNTETIRYHAKEHGVFMTVLSILPMAEYYQGISRFWFKGVNGDRFDYYTPEFENLGYQAVLNSEVWVPWDDRSTDDYQSYDPDGIFGFSPQYSEYKFSYSVLAGDFLGDTGIAESQVQGSLMDSWHLFRRMYFDDQNPLALNNNFVECRNRNESFDRIFQVTRNDLDHFYLNVDVDVKATRPMVGFAEPSLESVNKDVGRKINLPYGGTRL